MPNDWITAPSIDTSENIANFRDIPRYTFYIECSVPDTKARRTLVPSQATRAKALTDKASPHLTTHARS